MFTKVLIANRGEIAVRILKTAQRLDIKTVLVCSEADTDSLACDLADEVFLIGPAPASQSYLRADTILAAAKTSGAEAIHPGYGFLSENADFARQCFSENLVFIGPNPRAIQMMGDKIQSKIFAKNLGISVITGCEAALLDTKEAIKVANDIGYPVMIKASAGGGGKGMRVAWNDQDVETGFLAAKTEALKSFGDDRLLLEKFIVKPRHIEIQVLGDKHGHIIHLNERECSIQRRHQKVIEEAPSPFLDKALRKVMGDEAIALAKAVDYDSAGTVEFIVDSDRNFYFLEMNTRLQVEHPVTELITGVDLVEQMLRSAYGYPLSLSQDDITVKGWAIESRIYAEDPYRGFLPSIGRLIRYSPPEEGDFGDHRLRNDTGVCEGDDISLFYDPMIAKLCTHAKSRPEAIAAQAGALEAFHIEGPAHNIAFLSAIMDQERFLQGDLSTDYIDEAFPKGFSGLKPTERQIRIFTAMAVFARHLAQNRSQNPLPQSSEWDLILTGPLLEDRKLAMRLTDFSLDSDAIMTLDLVQTSPSKAFRPLVLRDVSWRPGKALFAANLDGEDFIAELVPSLNGYQIRHRAARAKVLVLSPHITDFYEKLPKKQPESLSDQILSPMPGLILSLEVEEGDLVKTGQTLAVIEAMKMQNTIRSERDGRVTKIHKTPGVTVAVDDILISLA